MQQLGKNVRWYPEKFMTPFEKHEQENLNLAAIHLEGFIKDSFGDSGVTGGRSGATKAQRAANRSQPWGPPNVDTGHLRRNVGHDTPGGRPYVRRIGTGIGNKESVGYAMWLEFGTRNMLPRPFLRPAVYSQRQKIRSYLSRPMN